MEQRISEQMIAAVLAQRAPARAAREFKGLVDNELPGDSYLAGSGRVIPALASVLGDKKAVQQARDVLEKARERGIASIPYGSKAYPQALAEIPDPPPIIFVKGTWKPEYFAELSISVVGTRKASPSSISLANSVAKLAANSGQCVVSGLALGVDSAAHTGALNAKAEYPTLAVLGSGLNKIYPASNFQLARRIIEGGGAVISQFEPDAPPLPHNFLNRNRLIAGLSKATVVVQAAKRSGSLATARYALEAGRDVWAVPGSINEPGFAGCNNLIRDGAFLLGSIDDLREAYSLQLLSPKPLRALRGFPMKVIKAIGENGQLDMNELFDHMGDISATLAALSELEQLELVLRTSAYSFALSSEGILLLETTEEKRDFS